MNCYFKYPRYNTNIFCDIYYINCMLYLHSEIILINYSGWVGKHDRLDWLLHLVPVNKKTNSKIHRHITDLL